MFDFLKNDVENLPIEATPIFLFFVQIVVRAAIQDRQLYCSTLREPCCNGRQDSCSLPIDLNRTRCYCDSFCLKTKVYLNGVSDCCPDYNKVCKRNEEINQDPYKYCHTDLSSAHRRGIFVNPGQIIKMGCNKCTCQDLMEKDLGMMALMCDHDECVNEEKEIRSINNLRKDWRATNHPMFEGEKLADAMRQRLGTNSIRRKVGQMLARITRVDPNMIPDEFDARKKWPWIQGPENQGQCGASWALSTAGVASDRWAIATHGRVNGLSHIQLRLCMKAGKGCNGGQITKAWKYLYSYGLLPKRCLPWDGKYQTCPRPLTNLRKKDYTAECTINGTYVSLKRMGPAYRIGENEMMIQQEIFKNGPVQAVMDVYRDFFLYKEGIYSCPPSRPGKHRGFHSIRIIGWGSHGFKKYWLAVNSWGHHWGEDGYFKIARGHNECNVESFVIAANTYRSTKSRK